MRMEADDSADCYTSGLSSDEGTHISTKKDPRRAWVQAVRKVSAAYLVHG